VIRYRSDLLTDIGRLRAAQDRRRRAAQCFPAQSPNDDTSAPSAEGRAHPPAERARLPEDWREQLTGLDVIAFLGDRLVGMEANNAHGWAQVSCPLGVDEHAMLVHLGHGGYRCDRCHAHGDLVQLVQQLDEVRFPDAVRILLGALHDQRGAP